MAERQVGQLSFADDLVADAGRANATLRRLAELIDWSEAEALLSGLRSGPMGAPAYPALALFKALLLQQCYGLSDPQLGQRSELLAQSLLELRIIREREANRHGQRNEQVLIFMVRSNAGSRFGIERRDHPRSILPGFAF